MKRIDDLQRLEGRVAMVTGASSGLGAHFARVLHEAGASVAMVARRLDRLSALADELPRAEPFQADLSDPRERDRVVSEVLEWFGTVDVLVNNAGTGVVGPIEDEQLEDFTKVVELNLVAVWHLTKLVGATMVERGQGSVVNVSSILGLVGSSPVDQAGYAASKGAVVNLTRELALQWGKHGVRVNAIAPGWFPTEMTASMDGDGSQAYITRNTPLRRMGRLDELTGPLLLLATDAGTYLTGTTVVVDGGWTAR